MNKADRVLNFIRRNAELLAQGIWTLGTCRRQNHRLLNPMTPFKGLSSRHPESKAELQCIQPGVSPCTSHPGHRVPPPPQPIRSSSPRILSNIALLHRTESWLSYLFQAEVTAQGNL
ncbi:hypothetical protein AVEN_271985-1 [Araneus ventricosus]|uniref:Uncharacterized protein n=1 Tax=Araneus ventricosus TaxID=182803 RepID=A0A4Y2CBU5_ARAVE|nr:hypothetical protein AVEN_271985-1 [Araneus ventricosus]